MEREGEQQVRSGGASCRGGGVAASPVVIYSVGTFIEHWHDNAREGIARSCCRWYTALMRVPGKAAELEQLRMVAARMFEMELPTQEIAQAVGRDDQTIRQWRRRWKEAGVEGLQAKPHPGRTPKLDRQRWEQVLEMLLHSPQEHGYNAHLWTTPLMARLIQEKFGVSYHHDYIGEMLHKLGWSCQRPAKQARERDEQAIAYWREMTWPELLKKVKSAAQ